MRPFLLFIYSLFFVALANCTSKKVEPIDFNHDSCHYCKMLITDKRFGAEIVASKGKNYKFDSLECMQNFEGEQPDKVGAEGKRYVVDTSSQEGVLILVDEAFYFVDPKIRSPMGLGFMTSSSEEGLKKLVGADKSNQFIRWNEVKSKLPSVKGKP